MKVIDATVERFSGPTPVLLGNARRMWRERSGLLLSLRDDEGHTAQGEATPLPGYSPDDLDGCRVALDTVDWDEQSRVRGASLLEMLACASRSVPPELPAARFAIETALLDLAAQRARRPAWSLLRAGVRRLESQPLPIPLCGLLARPAADEREVLDSATRLLGRGLTTLKLKLGYDGDIELARALRARAGERVLLRFDANRGWPAAEVDERLRELSGVVPELVEEPTAAFDDLGSSPVPLALDETLQSPGALDRLRQRFLPLRLDAVVLKPAALGGLVRCVELAARAQGLGLGVIVSHLFDGPVGLAAAGALALAVASPERASGLDRHAGLAAWPATPIPIIGETHVLPIDAAGLGLEPLQGAQP